MLGTSCWIGTFQSRYTLAAKYEYATPSCVELSDMKKECYVAWKCTAVFCFISVRFSQFSQFCAEQSHTFERKLQMSRERITRTETYPEFGLTVIIRNAMEMSFEQLMEVCSNAAEKHQLHQHLINRLHLGGNVHGQERLFP